MTRVTCTCAAGAAVAPRRPAQDVVLQEQRQHVPQVAVRPQQSLQTPRLKASTNSLAALLAPSKAAITGLAGVETHLAAPRNETLAQIH